MITTSFKGAKIASYSSFFTMSAAFALPPLLFGAFHEMYGISYTLLGTLVLLNFCTQLTVDLIFTFLSKHFNIKLTVTAMPLITSTGLLIYALVPTLFPQFAYPGLVAGTIIFSVSAGLSEVLISPIVAAIPSKNPEKEMSLLHSLYAWGVITVVIISSIFLRIFGTGNWMWLTLFWAAAPIITSLIFHFSTLPHNVMGESAKQSGRKNTYFGLALCTLCIFLGGAAENSMTNWISVYIENSLNIPKVLGDVLGMALFALLLGTGRILYSKYSFNIIKVLFLGMLGATLCYLTAGLSPLPIISMIACVLTGLCTSMLWPGTLILMEEKFPHIGVAAYALMAAGGDCGSSVAPQLLGAVTDAVSESSWAKVLGTTLSLSGEQLGMKVGMLVAALFPLMGVFLVIYMKRYFKNKKRLED